MSVKKIKSLLNSSKIAASIVREQMKLSKSESLLKDLQCKLGDHLYQNKLNGDQFADKYKLVDEVDADIANKKKEMALPTPDGVSEKAKRAASIAQCKLVLQALSHKRKGLLIEIGESSALDGLDSETEFIGKQIQECRSEIKQTSVSIDNLKSQMPEGTMRYAIIAVVVLFVALFVLLGINKGCRSARQNAMQNSIQQLANSRIESVAKQQEAAFAQAQADSDRRREQAIQQARQAEARAAVEDEERDNIWRAQNEKAEADRQKKLADMEEEKRQREETMQSKLQQQMKEQRDAANQRAELVFGSLSLPTVPVVSASLRPALDHAEITGPSMWDNVVELHKSKDWLALYHTVENVNTNTLPNPSALSHSLSNLLNLDVVVHLTRKPNQDTLNVVLFRISEDFHDLFMIEDAVAFSGNDATVSWKVSQGTPVFALNPQELIRIQQLDAFNEKYCLARLEIEVLNKTRKISNAEAADHRRALFESSRDEFIKWASDNL